MTVDDIALTFEPGISHGTTAHLLSVFGSAAAIYTASIHELTERAELNPTLAARLQQRRGHRMAAAEMEWIRGNGVQAIASTDAQYPPLLRECPDYPHVLYVKGDPDVLIAPMLSMVGTRNINSYGLSVCNRLVTELAALMPELVIVSGLAYGVDVACHRAALSCGLRTVAVMGNPAGSIYPSVHKNVAQEMVSNGGALLTELSSGEIPTKGRFLQRNRIVAGMSAGTVVVQSALAGGSMVTAGLADGYHRCVMAPPANIGEEKSAGTNLLLRSMRARMVCSANDVLDELGWQPTLSVAPKRTAARPEGVQGMIFDVICEKGGAALEELVDTTSMTLQELLATLLDMEFAGYIRSLPGNRYERL